MEPVIITLVVILGLLVLFDITLTIIIFSLKKRFTNRIKTVDVLTAQKCDLLVALAKQLRRNDIELPEQLTINLDLNADYNLKYVTTSERLSIKALFASSETIIFDLIEKLGQNDDEIVKLKANVDETTSQLRRETAAYNNDVAGYNYWRRFIVYRPVAFILRLKEAEYIK